LALQASERVADLATLYARLDPQQREAVDAREDVVVLAGPGSGKTDTLSIKGAVLLQEIQAPQGLACITFTRAAAREIQDRIEYLSPKAGRRLFTGTVHAFCLRRVIQPFSRLTGDPLLSEREVISAGTASRLRIQASEYVGLGSPITDARLQWIRRDNASGEDLEKHFDRFEINAMERYEELLDAAEAIDYDRMVHEALGLIREHPRIADLISAQFPWLLVDEYQDLGGPLHRLVQTLRQSTPIRLMAVGDPDQTIMQFTGAGLFCLSTIDPATNSFGLQWRPSKLTVTTNPILTATMMEKFSLLMSKAALCRKFALPCTSSFRVSTLRTTGLSMRSRFFIRSDRGCWTS
jgi:superfamily I DNA/RNA helicase